MKLQIIIIICIIIFILFKDISEKYENIGQPYYLVVGAAFKNEAHILDEWINHYKLHGIDHIYLINDNSDDNYLQVLEPYIKTGYVTLFNNTLQIDKYPRQKYVYEEYFRKELLKSKWWTIIDLDEFLYAPNEIDIKKIVQTYENKGDQLFVKWRMFGSSGHIEQPNLVVPNFTKCKSELETQGKTIFKSDKLKEFNVHTHNVDGNLVWTNDLIINHYAIQSWKFFERVKMTRGDADKYAETVGVIRDKSYFDKYDYNEIEDIALLIQNKKLI